jgi:periplasmic copper chaperone A
MMVDLRVVAGGLLCLLTACSTASAHVALEVKQAKVGAGYKAIFGVPHGCEGQATTEVSIDIPEGVIGVKPMPKAGWTLALQKGPYARTYKFHHGETKSEGVKRVTWSGGSLPDEFFDQFVLSTFVAGELEPGATLYFPVTQKCATGEQSWTEIPAEGQDAHSLDHPAPQLMLVAGEDKHDHAAKAPASSGTIAIDAPWSRPASAGGNGAGYLKITNNGTDADVLLGASSDVAARVEVHETTIDDKGVASMKKLDTVELKSGQSIELKPAGMHVMFIGLKEPLKEGGVVKAQLKFKKAGDVAVEFAVKTAAPAAEGGHEHMHHDH